MARDYERLSASASRGSARAACAAAVRRWWPLAVLTAAAIAVLITGALIPASSGGAIVKVGATSIVGYAPTAVRAFLPTTAGTLAGPLEPVLFSNCSFASSSRALNGAVAVAEAIGNCTYAELVNAILAIPGATTKAVVFALTTGTALGDGLGESGLGVVFVATDDAHWLAMQVSVSASLYLPFVPILDPSAFALLGLAVLVLLIAAAWRSAVVRLDLTQATEELGSGHEPRPSAEPKPVAVTVVFAVFFIISGAGMLLLLFYLPSVIVYITMGLFAVLSFSSGIQAFSALLRLSRARKIGWLQRILHKYRVSVRRPAIDVSVVHLVFAAVWAGVIVWWGVERNASYAWVLQDLMGMVLMVAVLQSVVLSSVRVASVLLLLAFCYDIVFVFGTDIMETVALGSATGEQVPLLLRMPHFIGEIPSYGALGYGDVVLPGLLVLFMREFDLRRQDRLGEVPDRLGYFAWAMMAYVAGLLATFVALLAMQQAQPALLYLVPAVLGTVLAVAWRRKEFSKVWSGVVVTDDDLVNEQRRLGSLLAAQDDTFLEDGDDDML